MLYYICYTYIITSLNISTFKLYDSCHQSPTTVTQWVIVFAHEDFESFRIADYTVIVPRFFLLKNPPDYLNKIVTCSTILLFIFPINSLSLPQNPNHFVSNLYESDGYNLLEPRCIFHLRYMSKILDFQQRRSMSLALSK